MKIADLVNKVEPFRFDYDGFVLEGEWYKYKTTTPEYAHQLEADIPAEPAEDASHEEKIKAMSARARAFSKTLHRALADTIKTWNVVDNDNQPVPVTSEVFDILPSPFIDELSKHFKSLRDVTKNPTSPSSPST